MTEVAQNDYQIALGRFLRIALADADSEVRRLAIEGLNGEYESDLIGPLIQILHNDDDAATRAAAAAALGAFILAGELEELDTALSMRVEETLLSILTQPEEAISVQCRALESIAYSGETGVRQLIEDAYYSQYEEMRISSLIAMGRSADVRWRGLARAELQNPSAAMRREAAYTCGELETSAAAEDLIGLVEDNDKDVRLAAIYALGHIGGPDAREILETVRLGDDPDEVNMADLALEELMFFSSPDGNPLMEELFDAPDERDDEPWSKNADDDLDFGSYEE